MENNLTDAVELLIIGAGPAGMSAAVEAAARGVKCVIIDESPSPGGPLYRQIRGVSANSLNDEFKRGKKLLEEFINAGSAITVMDSTSVLGIWNNNEVMWASANDSGIMHPRQMIIATGAYERPMPFPGWTLPGVVAAGGIKSFINTMHVRPGTRAIVSGTGPMIINVANTLHAAGIEVIAVLEAGNPGWLKEEFLHERETNDFAKQIKNDLEDLKKNGIPHLLNHSVFEAQGQAEVTGITYGPVDPVDWKPLKDKGIFDDADLVVLGYGFVPNTELTALAGCAHEFHEGIGWFAKKDEWMQTSVRGVLAAGDCAGNCGTIMAELQGRIAGIKASENLNKISSREAEVLCEKPMNELRSLEKMRKLMNRESAIRPGLLELMRDDTYVCRCEEVSLSAVKEAVDKGSADLQSLKLFTRLGMGACQGRNCSPAAGMYLGNHLNLTPGDVGRINPRPPVRPVTLGTLAKLNS